MPSQSPLIIISGPTATGKTALAIKLARKFNGELVSADSRQIYRGMDIGTGKDHLPHVTLHLIDLITPDQTFSVTQYRQLALKVITAIHSRHKLPIIVGGSGQYIAALLHPQATYSLPPSAILRFFLNRFPLSVLQLTLKLLDFKTFGLLNHSDLHNPRRLIRKIEIRVLSNINPFPSLSREGLGVGFDYLHLSLTAPNPYLYARIDERVAKRLDQGLLTEVKRLVDTYGCHAPGLQTTIAYKEFLPMFSSTESPRPVKGGAEGRFVSTWRFHEHALARRQKNLV